MIVRIPYGGVALDLLDESTTIAGNTLSMSSLAAMRLWEFRCSISTPVVVNGVWNPKHIAWDNYDDMLFIADYGNSRILAFNEQWVSGNGGLPCIQTDGAWNFPQSPRLQLAASLMASPWTASETYISPTSMRMASMSSRTCGSWNSTNYALNTSNQSSTAPSRSPIASMWTSGEPCMSRIPEWGPVSPADMTASSSTCPRRTVPPVWGPSTSITCR